MTKHASPRPQRSIQTTNAAKVKAAAIEWLWEPFIPRGFYTDLHGDGKVGKGVLINGHVIPELCRQGVRTLYLTAEDPPAQVCVPRLYAAGLSARQIAKVEFVDCVKRTSSNGDGTAIEIEERFRFPDVVPELRALVATGGFGLVYFDPIVVFMSGDLNAHNEQDVRDGLGPLDEMAQATGCAVVGLRHISKDRDKMTSHAGSGSVAWRNAARSSILVGRNPADPDQRVVAPNGFNYSAEGDGVAYRIRGTRVTVDGEDYDKVAQIYDVGACSLTADDLLVKAKESSGTLPAIEVLNEYFDLHGDVVESSKIKDHLHLRHIGRETMDAATRLTGVVKRQVGAKWYWGRNEAAFDSWWPSTATVHTTPTPAASPAPPHPSRTTSPPGPPSSGEHGAGGDVVRPIRGGASDAGGAEDADHAAGVGPICPTCRAAIGERCTTVSGRPTTPHRARLAAQQPRKHRRKEP